MDDAFRFAVTPAVGALLFGCALALAAYGLVSLIFPIRLDRPDPED